MQINHFQQRLQALGAKAGHSQWLLRHWVQGLPLDGGRRRPDDFIPLTLRDL